MDEAHAAHEEKQDEYLEAKERRGKARGEWSFALARYRDAEDAARRAGRELEALGAVREADYRERWERLEREREAGLRFGQMLRDRLRKQEARPPLAFGDLTNRREDESERDGA